MYILTIFFSMMQVFPNTELELELQQILDIGTVQHTMLSASKLSFQH